ncbi:MAG: AAA family ATPase [Candidatus Omnitrophica bacterium]|nr:AAA family ATPase [Candidatus Omnitrophota bacterium]
MYEAFYGFRERPFHVTADPTYLFPSEAHQEALDHLLYGIRQRLGFLMITGEVGTGKTTLAKTLVDQLEKPAKTALILSPVVSGAQLLRMILRDFGVLTNGSTRGALLARIEAFLLEQAATGGVGVLILDEAQALSVSTLEQLRLLSNIETPKAKLLQIVLVGQPELEERLSADRRLRALNERIVVRYAIQPLKEEEVALYIRHRLQVAGAREGIPRFTEEAIRGIVRASQGIPRRINRICDEALLAGYVRESTLIDASMIAGAEKAPEETALCLS